MRYNVINRCSLIVIISKQLGERAAVAYTRYTDIMAASCAYSATRRCWCLYVRFVSRIIMDTKVRS